MYSGESRLSIKCAGAKNGNVITKGRRCLPGHQFILCVNVAGTSSDESVSTKIVDEVEYRGMIPFISEL
jgi:hypothetical protein